MITEAFEGSLCDRTTSTSTEPDASVPLNTLLANATIRTTEKLKMM